MCFTFIRTVISCNKYLVSYAQQFRVLLHANYPLFMPDHNQNWQIVDKL
jgi:hypothetical protein